jgi:hypothetical protein
MKATYLLMHLTIDDSRLLEHQGLAVLGVHFMYPRGTQILQSTLIPNGEETNVLSGAVGGPAMFDIKCLVH